MSITRLGGQGNHFINIVTQTGPASYLAGGFDLTASDCGLSKIVAVFSQDTITPDDYVLGATVAANGSKSTTKVYDTDGAGGVLTEVADTTDLSADTYTFLVIGKG